MKTIIIVLFALVVGVGVYSYDNDVVVENEVIEVVEEEIVPEWQTDEDAIKAAQDVIQRKVWEADETRLEGQIEALQSELDETRKSLGTY